MFIRKELQLFCTIFKLIGVLCGNTMLIFVLLQSKWVHPFFFLNAALQTGSWAHPPPFDFNGARLYKIFRALNESFRKLKLSKSWKMLKFEKQSSQTAKIYNNFNSMVTYYKKVFVSQNIFWFEKRWELVFETLMLH